MYLVKSVYVALRVGIEENWFAILKSVVCNKIMRIESSDIYTVPNAMSAAGFGLVIKGIHEGMDTSLGLGLVFAGRMVDVFDGKVAKITGQESDFGAALDASLDKAGVVAILAHQMHKDIIPCKVATGIIAQNAANIYATVVTKSKHPGVKIRPTYDGKRAMFSQNLSLGAYGIKAASESKMPNLSRVSNVAAYSLACAGILYYGIKASTEYFNRMGD
jgi:phosphatidylglycerophosphate synthase